MHVCKHWLIYRKKVSASATQPIMRHSLVASLTIFFLVVPHRLVQQQKCGAAAAANTDGNTDTYTLEYTRCSTSRNFSGNSPYQVNLGQLLAALPSTAVNSSGSFNGTAGSAPDAVFGSAMCQADIPWPEQCSRCLQAATGAAASACPVSRNASIGYRGCVVRYSDTPIPAVADNGIAYLTQNHPASVAETIAFQQARTELFTALSGAASISPIKVATSNRTLNATHRMYGMAQCIRYLPGDECSRCIRSLVTAIPATALLSEGVSLTSFNCYIRYDLQPFRVYDPSADAAEVIPGATMQRGPKAGSIHQAEIIAILVSIFIIVMLVVIMVARHCLRKRKYKKLEKIIALSEFSFNEIKQGTENFREILGEGGFGQVYKGTLTIDDESKEVAVKRVTDKAAAKTLLRELSLLATLRHQNVVRLVGWSFSGLIRKKLYVCNEFLKNGSLETHIFGSERLPWQTRFDIIKGICEGLQYLHVSCGDRIVAHMDIKPNNILLDDDMTPKIADLGLSRPFTKKDKTYTITSKVIGSPGYMAPEYVNDGKVERKCDIYSLGVLIMAIVMGKGPDKTDNLCGSEFIRQIGRKLAANNEEQLKQDASLKDGDSLEDVRVCIELALKCVQEDPLVRPTADDVINILRIRISKSTHSARETQGSIGYV